MKTYGHHTRGLHACHAAYIRELVEIAQRDRRRTALTLLSMLKPQTSAANIVLLDVALLSPKYSTFTDFLKRGPIQTF